MKKLSENQAVLILGGDACSSDPAQAAVCFAEQCLVFGLINHVISVVVNGAPLTYSCNV